MLLTIFLFCLLGFASSLKVLWIGNSFTYYNDLPSMVSQLAVAGGQQYEYDSHLEGGWSWEDHVASDLTMDKIRSQVWDVVILQEYSTRPAYDEEVVCEQTVPPLDTLISAIQDNNPDTKIQFYLTWGWPHGAPDLCNQNMTQFCSYESMQDALTHGYMSFACMNKPSNAAPVGEAFRHIRQTHGEEVFYELYKDYGGDKHPSLIGSYISALTHYMTLYNISDAAGSLPTFGLDETWVRRSWSAAEAVINNFDWSVGVDEDCQDVLCQ